MNGLKKLIKFKKKRKFVYLVSPNKIKSNSFYNQLKQIFKLKKHKKFLIIEQKCVVLHQKVNGLKKLIIFKNKKKFVYLISPNKIKSNNFYNQLEIGRASCRERV